MSTDGNRGSSNPANKTDQCIDTKLDIPNTMEARGSDTTTEKG